MTDVFIFSATEIITSAKKRRMINFDPRLPQDRAENADQCYSHVTALTALCPETGLRHLWGISPVPPEFTAQVEVTTSLSIEQKVAKLILCRNSVSADVLNMTLDHDIVEQINEQTKGQAKCSLWHDLRKGRLTSSNFGAIYHSVKSPSLARKILDNRFFIYNTNRCTLHNTVHTDLHFSLH